MSFKNETQLLNQWLAKKHRTSPQWRRARLGKALDPKEAAMMKVLLRWADAIFIEDGQVNIVEAKLRPDPKAVGQLEMYEKLFKKTDEFKKWWGFPIRLWLLTTMEDKEVREFVEDKGIIYEVFNP